MLLSRFRQAFKNLVYGSARSLHQIAVDSRHSQVEILSCEPIAERAFADWSMKLIGSDDAPTAVRRELLERYTGSSRFDPHATSGAAAFAFLREMAEMERHALTVRGSGEWGIEWRVASRGMR